MAIPASPPKVFVHLEDDVPASLVPGGVLNLVSAWQVVEDARNLSSLSRIEFPPNDLPTLYGPWNPAGIYQVTFSAEFSANPSGERLLIVRKNGVQEPWAARDSRQAVSSAGKTTSCQVSEQIRLNKGDYLEFFTRHEAGLQLNIVSRVTLAGPVAF